MNNVLAIDIGGTRCRVGLFAPDGLQLKVEEFATQRAGGRDWMLKELDRQWRAISQKSAGPISACGISFGGPVDFARQRVRSLHTPGWDDFELAHWVEENLSLPCRLENDANCGALGEYRFGAGSGTESMVYITLSTGIGGGVIVNGELLRGKDGLAGEFGHLPVSDTPVKCSCGANGCLEVFCSGDAIALRAQEMVQRRPEGSRMAELSATSPITAQAVYQAAAEGELAAVQIVSEAARWLARALCFVIRAFDPEKIVLGGGVTAAGNMFLLPVQGFVKDFTAASSVGFSTEIELAQLGQYSPLYGAATLALDLAAQRSSAATTGHS